MFWFIDLNGDDIYYNTLFAASNLNGNLNNNGMSEIAGAHLKTREQATYRKPYLVFPHCRM